MDEKKRKEPWQQFFCPYSAGMEFQVSLQEAESLMNSGRLEDALQLLRGLEGKYILGARLFELMGEALHRTGDVEDSIKYRTFHGVLRGTFATALGDEATLDHPPPADEVSTPMDDVTDSTPESTAALGEIPDDPMEIPDPLPEISTATDTEAPDIPDLPEDASQIGMSPVQSPYPITEAMGQEFMRQGHFDRAHEIFARLTEKNPGNVSLQKARDLALIKKRERQVVTKLNKWLGNVKLMKMEGYTE